MERLPHRTVTVMGPVRLHQPCKKAPYSRDAMNCFGVSYYETIISIIIREIAGIGCYEFFTEFIKR